MDHASKDVPPTGLNKKSDDAYKSFGLDIAAIITCHIGKMHTSAIAIRMTAMIPSAITSDGLFLIFNIFRLLKSIRKKLLFC